MIFRVYKGVQCYFQSGSHWMEGGWKIKNESMRLQPSWQAMKRYIDSTKHADKCSVCGHSVEAKKLKWRGNGL